jgi:hypothetical protein
MLMPSSLSVRNILLAIPTWLRMPLPTMLTLQMRGPQAGRPRYIST